MARTCRSVSGRVGSAYPDPATNGNFITTAPVLRSYSQKPALSGGAVGRTGRVARGGGIPGLFPKLDVVTNPDLIYIRFHGRNAKGWRSGNMQKQFNYDYPDDELREWAEDKIEKMAKQARTGVIFFNNHVRAQAPANARKLINQLMERGFLVDFGFQS